MDLNMSALEKPYLHFTPEAIIDMDLDPDTNEQIGYVILKNISDSPVGYKFRCSNKTDVTVQPAWGVLGATEEKQVVVSYLNWHPDHSQHEKLQVLVTPLDDLYHADQNLQGLFKRATDEDVQEHRLQIQSGTPRIQTVPQERNSSYVAPISPRRSVPIPVVQPSRKSTSTFRTQEIPPNSPGIALHRNSTPTYRPQNLVSEVQETEYPTYRVSEVREVEYPAYRSGALDRGQGHPHFKINYPEERLSDKIRTRNDCFISSFNRLPFIHDLMMSDNCWRRILTALISLVVLIVLVGFAIRTGLHYRRKRGFVEGVSMFGETAISSTATAVAELGESLLEDYRKMTLDEYIHMKMT